MTIEELRQSVELRLERRIPDEEWNKWGIWYFCLADADAICDDNTYQQVAEMIQDGIKPKTWESMRDWIESLDAEDADYIVQELVQHFKLEH